MSFEGWDEVKLGELIESVSVTHSLNDDKVIFLNTSDILEGKVLHHTYSPVKGLPGQAKKSIKKHDILFSEIRPANKRFAYIDFDADDYVVSTKLMVLRRISGRINNRFLYHILTSREMLDYLQGVAEARSGTFPQITFNELRKIKISLPPYDEQVGICNVIESIQGKIDLNNAINNNLEEMAQALFKRWFVDFEFPNENGKPYKSSGGEFEESELGLIPKGWNISSLKDISTIMMGQSPKSEYYNTTGEGLPFHQGVSDYGYRFPKHNTFCTNLLRVAKKDSILISVRAPVGRLNIADRDIVIGRGLGAINSIINCNSYLFYLLKRIFAVEDRHGSGTIFNSITKKEVEEIKVISPSSTIIHRFENIVKNIDQQISVLSAECDYLAQIRDTLLPKLMSGEIRVPVEQDHNDPDLPMVAESSVIYQP